MDSNINNYWQTDYFINYTRVQEVTGDQYNLAPRFHSKGITTGGTGGQ